MGREHNDRKKEQTLGNNNQADQRVEIVWYKTTAAAHTGGWSLMCSGSDKANPFVLYRFL